MGEATLQAISRQRGRRFGYSIHMTQPRPQGHLCERGEEIDDPGKGCKNLQDSWRFLSMRRQ